MSVIPIEAPPAILPRRRQLLFGTGLGVAAIAMFFLTLLGLYLSARHGHRAVWLKQNNIPLTQPTMQLFTLLMSSVTMQWAVYSIARDDRGHAYLALGITTLFGLAFINQTWFLYVMVGLKMSQVEGPSFYAITGAHLAMLVAALLLVLLTGIRALGGSMSSRHPDAMSATAIFWHGMVALYCVIWLAVYVMK